MTGLAGIKRIIPHRYPVLLVDRVSEVEPGRRLTAHKAITGREPCYQRLGDDAGPEDYAYPVSLLLESWAQAAVLLTRWEEPSPNVLSGKVELLSGIRHVELLEPVFPGHVVEHRVEVVRSFDDDAILSGCSRVDGRKVVEIGTFTLARRAIEALCPGGGGSGHAGN